MDSDTYDSDYEGYEDETGSSDDDGYGSFEHDLEEIAPSATKVSPLSSFAPKAIFLFFSQTNYSILKRRVKECRFCSCFLTLCMQCLYVRLSALVSLFNFCWGSIAGEVHSV